jgi:hypothetical protein
MITVVSSGKHHNFNEIRTSTMKTAISSASSIRLASRLFNDGFSLFCEVLRAAIVGDVFRYMHQAAAKVRPSQELVWRTVEDIIGMD